MKKTKHNIIILIISLACITGVTSLAGVLKYINVYWLRIAALVLLNLLNGAVAFSAMKLTGMNVEIDFAKLRQYAVGAIIAIMLSMSIGVIPALCGCSLVGTHVDFSWFGAVYDFLFYLLIIGPVEEFVFRVYLQDAFIGFFDSHKWIGVVLAALLFGLWHIINGNIVQVIFTFGIGLVFGFAKYRISSFGYPGVALAHGLYDFLNSLVRMFIV